MNDDGSKRLAEKKLPRRGLQSGSAIVNRRGFCPDYLFLVTKLWNSRIVNAASLGNCRGFLPGGPIVAGNVAATLSVIEATSRSQLGDRQGHGSTFWATREPGASLGAADGISSPRRVACEDRKALASGCSYAEGAQREGAAIRMFARIL